MKIKENFMTAGKIPAKENVSDFGTTRLTRDRKEDLMYLCKIYNTANSQFVGSSFAEKVETGKKLKVGIKSFKKMGLNTTTSKSNTPAASSSSTGSSGLYGMVLAFVFTIICLMIGFAWVTPHFGAQMQDRLQGLRMNGALDKVLGLLRGYTAEHGIPLNGMGEEENPTMDPCVEEEGIETEHEESYEDKLRGYQSSSIQECSDDEYWRTVHHGAPIADDPASAR